MLQKTLEEVDGRLEAAENTVTSWGGLPQDANLADQHLHNVTVSRAHHYAFSDMGPVTFPSRCSHANI